jgi:4-hydroxybenzoate polyprenyltransferase
MLKDLIISFRPGHWVKNLILFAALIFAREYTDADKIGLAVVTFAAFCLGTSAVYLFNDVIDRENDKKHPIKSRRPIASGKVPAPLAVALSFFLMAAGLVLAALVNSDVLVALVSYLVINYAYSSVLKHLVIIDVMTIAAGFVLRAVAGGLAIEVPISPWLLVCTTLLALFLGFGKRRHELSLLTNDAVSHRRSLEHYSVPFLDQMISVVTASTLVAYAFYTLSPEVVEHFGTRWLSLTIPFVLYGIFRYLFLIFKKEQGGSPTKLLLTDPPLLICVLLWLVAVVMVFNFT